MLYIEYIFVVCVCFWTLFVCGVCMCVLFGGTGDHSGFGLDSGKFLHVVQGYKV